MPVPPPPDLTVITPLAEVLEAGTPLWRVHPVTRRPDEFNPSDSPGRFRPIQSGRRTVPTAYAAQSLNAALSETVFHDIPADEREPMIIHSQLDGKVRSKVTFRRDVELVSLRGAGPRRLRTSAANLIHTPPETYPRTARYAQALYRWSERPDGIVWDSRLYPGKRAFMLFGTRLRASQIEWRHDDIEPLWMGEGLEEVLAAADEAGVTVVL